MNVRRFIARALKLEQSTVVITTSHFTSEAAVIELPLGSRWELHGGKVTGRLTIMQQLVDGSWQVIHLGGSDAALELYSAEGGTN